MVFTIANFILSAILGLIPVVGGIFGLIIIIPGIAVAVRRLHDLNKSGWWLLAPYGIMLIGLIGIAATVEEGRAAVWVWVIAGRPGRVGNVDLDDFYPWYRWQQPLW